MKTNDDNRLEHLEGLLSPAEKRVYDWIKSDPTRPFCSKDIAELPIKCPMGSARNIILKLKSLQLIKLWCRDRLAFYILESTDISAIKKPMTVSRMVGGGLNCVQIDFGALLDSLPVEEFCKVHNVRLTFVAEGLYESFLNKEDSKPELGSKDISFGRFVWSKYRSLEVILHHNGTVSFRLDCGNCPIEASAVGFVCMAAFLGGVRNELLNAWRNICREVTQERLARVEDWKVVQWHYGRDSAQEFSGERFNITFKMWCGELARIYVHCQDKSQKLRLEIIQNPNKPLREAIAEKLNLCCGRCKWCSKPS
jgi:hypothetical protein